MFKWFWTILSLGAPERDFQMPSGASSPESTGSFSPDRENISYSFHRVHTITPVRESGLEVFLHKNVLIFLSAHSLAFLLVGSHSKFCFALLNSSCNMFSLSFFFFCFSFWKLYCMCSKIMLNPIPNTSVIRKVTSAPLGQPDRHFSRNLHLVVIIT